MCNKCRHVFHVHADFEQGYQFGKSLSCLSPEVCTSQKFTVLEDNTKRAGSKCKDYQEVKIQEQVNTLTSDTAFLIHICTQQKSIHFSFYILLLSKLVKIMPHDESLFKKIMFKNTLYIFFDISN